jgi:hypothetical protein
LVGANGIDAAVAAASQADVVVVVLGENSDVSGEVTLSSCALRSLCCSLIVPSAVRMQGHDRSSLELPGQQQQELVAKLAQTGRPLVLVLMNGRPLGYG